MQLWLKRKKKKINQNQRYVEKSNAGLIRYSKMSRGYSAHQTEGKEGENGLPS